MTLYWWMHWFWITAQLIFSIPVAHLKAVAISVEDVTIYVPQNRPLHRIIKSINQSPNVKSQISILLPFPTTSDTSDTSIGEVIPQLYQTKANITLNKTLCINPINFIRNSSLIQRNETQFPCNNYNTTDNQLLTSDNSVTTKSNTNISDEFGTSEDEFTTEKNFTEDVLINVTLTSVITTNERISANNESSSSASLSLMSITGISLGILLSIAILCTVSFLFYRRRYINKPQTLNDKCSNPDSSGYIDDNSMRENSEEMYSLDNDSFLNSLEAMTIQNYWTDNVKHTKL